MKDPGHHESDYEDCLTCGDDWPCKPMKRWYASKDYRIERLELQVKSLGERQAAITSENTKLRKDVHRLGLLTHGGLVPAFGDLAAGRTGGVMGVSLSVEHQDIGSFSGGRVIARGLENYEVTYDSPTGARYVNGRVTEIDIRKP